MSERECFCDYDLPDGIELNEDGRLEDEEGQLVYLTDGACRYNGKPYAEAACAYFSGPACYRSWDDTADPPTNQTAELRAILGAVKKAIRLGEDNISLLTDSQYAVKCITVWPEKWRQTERNDGTWLNVKGQPVANQALIKRILKTMSYAGIWVDFRFIPREENEIADRLAKDQVA